MTDKLNHGKVNGDSELINCEKAMEVQMTLIIKREQKERRKGNENFGI